MDNQRIEIREESPCLTVPETWPVRLRIKVASGAEAVISCTVPRRDITCRSCGQRMEVR
jgi:hypothetical protein